MDSAFADTRTTGDASHTASFEASQDATFPDSHGTSDTVLERATKMVELLNQVLYTEGTSTSVNFPHLNHVKCHYIVANLGDGTLEGVKIPPIEDFIGHIACLIEHLESDGGSKRIDEFAVVLRRKPGWISGPTEVS